MPRLTNQLAKTLLLLISLSSVWGCATLQLPRIDPTGQNIFLATPNYTTTAPLTNNSCLNALRPAYSQPPTPPPCEPPPVVASENFAQGPLEICQPTFECGPEPFCEPECPPLYCQGAIPVQTVSSKPSSRVVLRPARMIAPVGTEVVLLAGLCGPDGYLRTGERIDWLLSQDSVGNFVGVGPPDSSILGALHRYQQPGKVGSNLAVGKTGSVAQILTRGTPAVEDDVSVSSGQTWVSVTSAIEGVSHVTAYAPAAKDWNGRQQTSAIHWIDAQWVLPPPSIGRAGQQQTLVTSLTRATQAATIPGWIVRYQVVGGPPINFLIDGVQRPETAVEVIADAAGQAAVSITPQTQQPGVTQIAIEIIRPGSTSADLARLSVGQGGTSITWSAAGLSVTTAGPDVAQQGSTVVYTIDVANPGDLATDEIVVTSETPVGLTYQRSTPAAQVFGNRLEWRIGQLGPSQNTRLQVEYRADREMQVRHCATARSATGVTAESCATTNITNPGFSLRTDGPAQAEVGAQVQFRIIVTNVTDQTLPGVTLLDEYDAGLSHASGANPIRRSLGDLAARQTRDELAVTFTVTQPGRQCHRVKVTSADGREATAVACVVGVQPAKAAVPAMQIRCSGPTEANVNERVWMRVDITNTGQSPLTEVQIVDRYDGSLKALNATKGFQPTPGQLVWTVPQVQPGETVTRQVEILCQSPDQSACNRVTVFTRELPAESDQSCLVIYSRPGAPPPVEQPGAGQPPKGSFPPTQQQPAPNGPRVNPPNLITPSNPSTPAAPTSGTLVLKVSDSGDPVKAGTVLTYLVSVTNDRDVADKQVTLNLHLSPQLQFQQLAGPITQTSASADGRIISIAPIAELRPRETVTFRVQLRTLTPGLATLRATAQSLRTSTPVEATEQTTVNR